MARVYDAPIYEPNHDSHVWRNWYRDVGKSVSTVGSLGIVKVYGGDSYNLPQAGYGVACYADTADCNVTLPFAKTENIGEEVCITLLDDTYNAIISCKSGDTVVSDTSVTMNLVDMSLTFMVISANTWVIR